LHRKENMTAILQFMAVLNKTHEMSFIKKYHRNKSLKEGRLHFCLCSSQSISCLTVLKNINFLEQLRACICGIVMAKLKEAILHYLKKPIFLCFGFGMKDQVSPCDVSVNIYYWISTRIQSQLSLEKFNRIDFEFF
jgi:hypothetical protein